MLKIISDYSQKGDLVSQTIKFNNYGQTINSYYSAGESSSTPVKLTVQFDDDESGQTWNLWAFGDELLVFNNELQFSRIGLPFDGIESLTLEHVLHGMEACKRRSPKNIGMRCLEKKEDVNEWIMRTYESHFFIPRWASWEMPTLGLLQNEDLPILVETDKYIRTVNGAWWHKRNNHHWDLIDKMKVQDFGNEDGDFELVCFKSPHESKGILYRVDDGKFKTVWLSEGGVFTTHEIITAIQEIEAIAKGEAEAKLN